MEIKTTKDILESSFAKEFFEIQKDINQMEKNLKNIIKYQKGWKDHFLEKIKNPDLLKCLSKMPGGNK